MQFDPDIERCIKNPMEIRQLKEPRKTDVLNFLVKFRNGWHKLRIDYGFASVKEKEKYVNC